MPDPTPTDASLLDRPGVTSERRTVNGVRLHVVTAGDEGDPPVVLLHGFPEFWYGWHRSIEPLVDAGYRVLVPDQRGYNRSEKPEGTRPYRVGELSKDVVDLVRSTGSESAHLVGHDWGGAVAWNVALRHPDAVDRLVAVNIPHPTVFEETLTSNPRQTLRSWYMFFFQLPRLPEWFQRRGGYRPLVNSLRGAAGDPFTEEDLDRYRAAWSRERGLTGMINWYRALFRHTEDPPREQVTVPTAVIWGERDGYLLAEMADRSVEYCENGRLERIPDATHWVHHERPERVTDLVIDHLS
ncbi:alpha/beta fold hydrolase [Halorubrum aethiopicum]|uniref:alpha/beta fold hydrolase n=1 Tax=Halorubrum aethiopicum TaxID=1758255 RepID=UPI00082FD0CF|nr:alpha/beta hydrolase [Halorubrum aethiopicum]